MAENLINKRFVLFEKRANFEANKANLAKECIVFIADQQKIWTQGQFFTKDAFTQYQIGNKTYSPNDGWDPVNDTELADSIIKFVAGEGLVVSAGTNGEVTYSLASGTIESTRQDSAAGKFIKNITVNNFGQVTSIEYGTIEQNSYELESAKGASDGNAKITFSMTDAIDPSKNTTVEVGIKGKAEDLIAVTSDANGNIEIAHIAAEETINIESSVTDKQVSVLGGIKGDAWGHLTSVTPVTVPTKAYVDDEIDAVERLVGTSVEAALVLKGIVNSDSDLPETAFSGYTYKVASTFESAKIEGTEKQLNPGDVILCVGSDKGADNKETGANPVWAAIQSNVDIAGAGVLGLVKDGDTVEANRIYGVKVGADGSMTVNVPAQHIPTVTSKVVTAGAANAKSNAAVAAKDNLVYVNHLDKSDVDAEEVITSHSFAGAGAVKVSADASGNITIAATDNDTHYVVSCTEDASGMSISLTPTNWVDGEAGKAGAAQTVTVSSWAYPDATQQQA